jgi:hypothetical protein
VDEVENPVLAALEAYRRAHPRQADAVDDAMARGPQDSEAVEDLTASDPSGTAASEQTTLLSLEEAAVARDEAIGRVEEHADPALRLSYERLAIRLAHARAEFTTDAMEALAEAEGLPVPHEKRVFGPIMLGLARRGIIERTDRTVLSVRKSNHRRPIRVWKSRVHDDGA